MFNTGGEPGFDTGKRRRAEDGQEGKRRAEDGQGGGRPVYRREE